MKLQNMAVIFAIIIIPMTLILSAYIGTQIDTQSLWQSYNTKLLDATHDAVVAFELNTIDNTYSSNSDSLRRDVKASINTFFTSLASNFGTPGANTSYIEQYIPAILVTLYDGYYIYSPIETEYTNLNGELKTKYEHALKPYIQYTARYIDGSCDIVVNYSLDNYISVYGYMNGQYVSRSGYLIVLNDVPNDNGTIYKGEQITDGDAIKYYKEAKKFTNWIMNYAFSGKKIVDVVIPKNARRANGTQYSEFVGNNIKVLDVTRSGNDPESDASDFQGHKREVMRESIQANLNNAIYVYNQHTTLNNDFRMPILTEQDWDKILTNVNIVSFMQGMPVGTKEYNNYSIVTSTKNKQYVDKSNIYYVTGGYYHRIDCPVLASATGMVTGYKSVDFEKRKNPDDETKYKYNRPELACYTCIVNPLKQNSVTLSSKLKQAQYNAIGKERYKLNRTTKLLEKENQ